MARSTTSLAVQPATDATPHPGACARSWCQRDRRRSPHLAGLCVLVSVLLSWPAASSSAQADAAVRRLVVLHSGGENVPTALRNEVDKRVLSAVAERVRFAQAFGSQVPYEDIELAAGCTARGADCMQRIAASLDADWILVRELSSDRNGNTFLTLIAHDGPQAIVTRRAVAQLGEGERDSATVVPMLVERLYPSDPRSEGQGNPDTRSPARVVGWSSAALGSGLLVAGAAIGVLSQRDHRSYKDARFEVAADVDRGQDTLERAQTRARVANGLLISGAAASAAGAAALLWSYLKPRPDARQLRVGITPSRSGAALTVAGAWQGGL